MFAHAVEYRRERVAIIASVQDLDRPFVGNSPCQFRYAKRGRRGLRRFRHGWGECALIPSVPFFLGGAVDRAVQAPVQVGQRLLQGHGLAGVLVAQQLQFVGQVQCG